MSYECKTCMEVLNGETYYFLWTSQGYLVYHWLSELKSLAKISSNFFIKLENARTYALENSHKDNVAARLRSHIAAAEAKLSKMEGGSTR